MPGATRRFRTGQLLSLEGETGSVRVLEDVPQGGPDVDADVDAVVVDKHEAGFVLRGAAASPGAASGAIRVVRSQAQAQALEHGEVAVVESLAVAPSWEPYIVECAVGVVCEKDGGMFSRAATFAREHGLPCVVSAAGATSELRTGQMVALDANEGTVTLL